MKKRPPSPWKAERAAHVRQALRSPTPIPVAPAEAVAEALRSAQRQRVEGLGPAPAVADAPGVLSRSMQKRLAIMKGEPMPTHFPPPDEPPPTVMRKPVRFGPARAA